MTDKNAISLEEIALSYRQEMTSRARRILSSEADAEDAVQETLLAILKTPDILGGIERIGGWLITLVTRRCIDIIRKESSLRARVSEVGLADLFDVDDPFALMERDEVAQAVAESARRLDPLLRDAFVLNALEMKPFRVISKETGIPMGTLMARKKRAVDTIRQDLAKRGIAI